MGEGVENTADGVVVAEVITVRTTRARSRTSSVCSLSRVSDVARVILLHRVTHGELVAPSR